MIDKNKIAVIGAGISGITAGAILSDSCDVTLFESKPFIGGLVHCDRVQDVLYHRVGGHVFNSKNKDVLEWFWSKFDKQTEFIEAKRNAKIFYEKRFIGYPIENYLHQLDVEVAAKIIEELLVIHKYDSIAPMDHANFGAFLKATFGNTLFELYFKPYNQKIWKIDLDTVPMQWLEGKLPMPRLSEILIANITRQEESNMVHSTFFYPEEGGSQFIADRLSKGLTVKCNSPLLSVEMHEQKIRVDNTLFDAVVYTGDVRSLPDIIPGFQFEDKIKALRSNGTSSVLCECDHTDLSWLYIPEEKFKAHRIIYTGNFSSTNNAPNTDRSSCTVEFSGICSYEEMLAELEQLPGNLTAITFNQEKNSYVIQDEETRELIEAYKKWLSDKGIYLLGRFAEWEYYNMDKAMEAAFKLKKELLQKWE